MVIKRLLKWGAIVTGSVLAFAFITIVLCVILEVTINLDGMRQDVDDAATKALAREVNIEGPIKLVVSLQPKLEIREFRIANPSDWTSGDFIRAELVYCQIDIVPLLSGKIQIGEIKVDSVKLSPETNQEGKNNWQFGTTEKPKEAKKKKPEDAEKGAIEFVELRKLTFSNISVVYRDGGLDKSYHFKIDSLDGTAPAGQPVRFSLNGGFQEKPYNFILEGGSFEELMNSEKPWSMNLSGKTGQSPLTITAAFEPHEAVSEATLEIQAEKVTLGGIFKELNISDTMEVDVDRFAMKMIARGGNLKELLEKSDFDMSLENGRWVWSDPEEDLDMSFAINRSLIRSRAHSPIEINLDGTIQSNPFNVQLGADSLEQLVTDKEPWKMQLSGSFANADVIGNAVLTRDKGSPEVMFKLSSQKLNIGELLQQMNIFPSIKANVENIDFNIVARGKTPGEFIERSDLTVNIEKGQYTLPAADPKTKIEEGTALTLEKGKIQSIAGQPVAMEIAGRIKKKPYALSITGDSLVSLIKQQAPWGLWMDGIFDKASTKAAIRLMRPAKTPEARIKLETGKIDMGEMLSWLNVADGIKAGFGKMVVDITARGRSLNELALKSDLIFDLSDGNWLLINPNMKSPINVQLEEFSLDRLSDKPGEITAKGKLTKTFNKTELPVKFEINMALKKDKPKGSAEGKAAQTKKPMHTLTITGNISNSPFEITGSVDQNSKVPKAELELITEALNFGSVLSWLEIAKGLDAKAGAFKMHITAKGGTIEEILKNSDFRASLEDGRWVLQDPNTKAEAEINVRKGAIEAFSGKPITLKLDSRLKEVPIHINIQTETLGAFTEKINRIPLYFHIQAAGTKLSLSAGVPLPISFNNLDFKMLFEGEKLNSLDELLGVSLPPLGPYQLGGRFGINDEGYRISDFEVRIGQSDLTGEAGLLTKGIKPRLNIDLVTNRLQINDFDLGDWSAVKDSTPKDGGGAEKKETGTQPKGAKVKIKTLLSPEVMNALDSRLSINVKEVLSGEDSLGGGSVLAKLEAGRFSVDPLKLDIPGGSVKFSFAYQPSGTGITGEAHAKIEKFDFGILARRTKPDTRMKGLLSLYIDLLSDSPSIDTIMHNVNGHIDFGIWPEDFEAGIFDLWAVNLLTAILPTVDKEKGSKINCIIGQFSFKDGQMDTDKMAVDTTRMRVKGKSSANFKTEDIHLFLKPRGKRPEFFSLATPIEVKGKFNDFKFGIAAGGLLGTAARFITSPVHVPLRRIFKEDLPPEGYDLCDEPIIRERHKR